MTIDEIISNAALRYGIPSQLFHAIIQVESSGLVYATRYEPGYRWLWDVREDRPYEGDPENLPSKSRFCTQATELIGQRTSWGLVQIMGATARELGFQGPFLAGLLDPKTNTNYGAMYLNQLYRRFADEGGWEAVAAAYNAGSPRRNDDGRWINQQYIDRLREAGWEGES